MPTITRGVRAGPRLWRVGGQGRGADAAPVVAHGLGDAEFQRVADQRMADGHLEHAGHGTQEVGQVVAIEVVPGVDAQPRGLRGAGRDGKARQLPGLLRLAMRSGIGLGVQLHAIGTHGACGGHGLGQRVHEQADAHAQRIAFVDQRAQAVAVGRQVPAMVRRELAFAVGHEGHLLRPLAHEGHQVVEGVALDVVLGLRPVFHQRGKVVHVVRADVAFVGPRVHGDAVGASLQRQRGDVHDAGNAQVARVAQLGHLVDVDRQRGAAAAVGAVAASSATRGFMGVGSRGR
jgi:hypothetical protein